VRTDTYDPDKYECKPNLNPSAIYLKEEIAYEGKIYNAVLIGTQTWMTENLNFAASGSKCYDNSTANCDKYGRLYDWATAMALPSECNYSSCSSQINADKHQGICPSGWHLITIDEWYELQIPIVPIGKDISLKATSGWNNNNNGTDFYGFAALPSGMCSPSEYYDDPDLFLELGNKSFWWIGKEEGTLACFNCYDGAQSDRLNFSGGIKKEFFSVRCLKD